MEVLTRLTATSVAEAALRPAVVTHRAANRMRVRSIRNNSVGCVGWTQAPSAKHRGRECGRRDGAVAAQAPMTRRVGKGAQCRDRASMSAVRMRAVPTRLPLFVERGAAPSRCLAPLSRWRNNISPAPAPENPGRSDRSSRACCAGTASGGRRTASAETWSSALLHPAFASPRSRRRVAAPESLPATIGRNHSASLGAGQRPRPAARRSPDGAAARTRAPARPRPAA